ncbi:MAG: di-heme oxidoredictase family protein [Planctomycetota bacterium]
MQKRSGLLVGWVLLATIVVSERVVAQVVLQPRMGDALPGLTATELARFEAGKVQFERIFLPPEGLGPIFNDDSCASCHSAPAAGGSGSIEVTRFGLLNKGDPFDPLESLGGSLLQNQAISDPCMETVPPSANIVINRITTLAIGLGLIEGIPDSTLEAFATAGDGIIHWVQPLESPAGPLRAGRFGWKAQVATVMTFSGDAALNEMGLTNPLVGLENAPNGDATLLMSCDTVTDPEDPLGDFINAVTDFQRFAAGPPQTPRSGMSGEAIFIATGCASCHVATTFVTGTAPESALSGVAFKPYSDFLLHDMGSLGDEVVQGGAPGTFMRTAPLWGLRTRVALLHDGRVNTGTHQERIEQAVMFHGGEAVPSVLSFAALSDDSIAELAAFLDSLGRLEFDSDGDTGITLTDFIAFQGCFTGPGSFYTPDDPCAIHDVDQDGDVDLDDADLFFTVFNGVADDCDMSGEIDLYEILADPSRDCNGNLVLDSCDIAALTSLDVNLNDVPDECERFIRGDCNMSTVIDISDAISQLGGLFSGGAQPTCDDACDVNDDGQLDVGDVIFSLSYQFSSGIAPAAPFPSCGLDGTPTNSLGCDQPIACP